jgi:multicomponent Na+:H+ antiporter subunit G
VKAIAIDALLAIAVGACWLGAAGFLCLKAALDRLHCVSFVNAAAGLAVLIAAFVADGASDRAFKILVLTAVVLIAGAALAHATGRALVQRGHPP